MIDLLDANVLIALCVYEHPHHVSALRWIDSCEGFAVCPMTEGALLRYLFRVAHPGEGPRATREALGFLRVHSKYVMWIDDLSHVDAPLERIQGYKQVTDAYLVALAAHYAGRLVTFDQALVAVHPEAILVPISSV